MKTKLSIFSLLIITILLSCQVNSDNVISEITKTSNYPALIGKWKINQSCSTNGPICYELPLYDTVNFESSNTDKNEVYYVWKLNGENHKDLFLCSLINDTLLTGICKFNTIIKNQNGMERDTILQKYLEISFLKDKSINCRMKLDVFDNLEFKIVTGDVTNFYADKLK